MHGINGKKTPVERGEQWDETLGRGKIAGKWGQKGVAWAANLGGKRSERPFGKNTSPPSWQNPVAGGVWSREQICGEKQKATNTKQRKKPQGPTKKNNNRNPIPNRKTWHDHFFMLFDPCGRLSRVRLVHLSIWEYPNVTGGPTVKAGKKGGQGPVAQENARVRQRQKYGPTKILGQMAWWGKPSQMEGKLTDRE